MFFQGLARSAMKRALSRFDERRDSPRFEVPIYVRDSNGNYIEHYGRMGISGFYFETHSIPYVGQLVEIKVPLVVLGIEVETKGRVVSVAPSTTFAKVAGRFEEMPFETERAIARWLDTLSKLYQESAAVG